MNTILKMKDNDSISRSFFENDVNKPTEFSFNIAIIGGGPKGLYGLERLIANFSKNSFPQKIEIHIFNRTPFFGAGDIYRTDQPHYLLMNYNNGYINMWKHEEDSWCVKHQQSFTEWLESKNFSLISSSPYGYSPRAIVGEYLTDGFNQILNSCPENVKIISRVAEVIDLKMKENNYFIKFKTEEAEIQLPFPFHQVLIATGHRKKSSQHPLGVTTHLQDSIKEKYIGFVYPVQKKLSIIPTDAKVAIKGLGLTFIDTVLALTEGRGGKFKIQENGKMIYHPSGNEPAKIFPFSRTGNPMIPRKANWNTVPKKLFFFNQENLARKRKNKLTNFYDFKNEILPLLKQEITAAYYEILFQEYQQEFTFSRDFKNLKKQIDNFHHQFPDEEKFSLSMLFNFFPKGISDFHKYFMAYSKYILEEAEKGEAKSPIIAGAIRWKYLSDFFNEIYSFGKLDAAGHKDFLENYCGHFNRIAYGPPLINMKKIHAIAKASIIDYSFAQSPQVRIEPKNHTIILTSSDSKKVACDFYIDARIPKNNLEEDESPLYQSLLRQGIIRPFRNINVGNNKTGYNVGCVELSAQGNAITREGKIIKNITFTGTPTEGMTFDNDTLSRERNDFVSNWAKTIRKEIINFSKQKINV